MFGLDIFLPLLGAFVMLFDTPRMQTAAAPPPAAPRPPPPPLMADPTAALSSLAREWTTASADGGSAYGSADLDALLAPSAALPPAAPPSAALPPATIIPLPAPAAPLAALPPPAAPPPVYESGRIIPVYTDPEPFVAAPPPAAGDTTQYTYAASGNALAEQARTLYQYLVTHSGAARDRAYVAGLQTRLGLVGDGLVGRATAARIRELTGLTLPGF